MVANLTTPLIGIVSTIAIGRLGDPTLLGGVAIASVVFDCLFWLFAFLRMGTVALTAQALGAGDAPEQRAVLARALLIAAAIGALLLAVQIPLAALIFNAMGGSAVARRIKFTSSSSRRTSRRAAGSRRGPLQRRRSANSAGCGSARPDFGEKRVRDGRQ